MEPSQLIRSVADLMNLGHSHAQSRLPDTCHCCASIQNSTDKDVIRSLSLHLNVRNPHTLPVSARNWRHHTPPSGLCYEAGAHQCGPPTQDGILKLFRKLPAGGEGAARLQTLMFSATLHSPAVRALAARICHNPIFLDLKVGPAPLQPLIWDGRQM